MINRTESKLDDVECYSGIKRRKRGEMSQAEGGQERPGWGVLSEADLKEVRGQTTQLTEGRALQAERTAGKAPWQEHA